LEVDDEEEENIEKKSTFGLLVGSLECSATTETRRQMLAPSM